jgi:hypothetical protein
MRGILPSWMCQWPLAETTDYFNTKFSFYLLSTKLNTFAFRSIFVWLGVSAEESKCPFNNHVDYGIQHYIYLLYTTTLSVAQII